MDGPAPLRSRSTVFCTVRAPYRRLSPAAIRAIMGYAPAGGPAWTGVGAHRLRHSLATDMLRAGASLPEVGQVLRHRSQLATSDLRQGRRQRAARRWRARGRAVVVSESAAGQAAEDYLAMRRALGFKLTTTGRAPDEVHRLLRGPPRRHGDHRAGGGLGDLRPRAAAATRSTGARRLMVVRIFARHLQTAGSGHRGPARGRAGRRQYRRIAALPLLPAARSPP